MPDWERLVTERLAQIQLAPHVRREVVVEIAAHLEEHYLELLETGSADPEGQTLAQVPDWYSLCQNIRRAKEEPMGFARRVVVPALAAAIVSVTVLKLCVYLMVVPQPCGVDATCIRVAADGPAYLPWLATLPLAGGLAAWLARSMGARPVQRLIAALSPALYHGIETLVVGLLFGFYWRIPIYWVLIPAMACAIGASPFLGGWHGPVQRRFELRART